ncbi:MAG: hypothetical protein ACD_24C00455G0002 [uncultured bacterium]|uniref:Uncharacterized protein n=5 Tax=Candidatus Amesiibacteriota TaxID=1752730 RepID=A0A1F4ZCY0_9BACT|nr:MAG: hypothetical protein ACD_24C00455G0002 [uncultured bacterium]KKU55252.1 MAG: hypothetical protein UX78_C0023G0004 [Candidatus Amesbacteria bacterium GW2011_GWA2_47_11]KKU92090.1 MAG: hypothetical protein UY22_C0039G0003 [Candidatus Amesbacteria bacterium GW2011_GWC1_48_10]KKW00080.1 MAG: hypothetical protein UY33_C0016G0004 [Candidatus Amesbacteria bacterium GW2011_GWA1_48_9]OGC90172.1 MAG: hypothetical protein A2V48_01400 [Candidatus Amesbacteria bacterium RBG_19FT_COMBO_48_16]OGC9923
MFSKKKENPPFQSRAEHTIRLGCGHFITMNLTDQELNRLGEEMEENNLKGKSAYCSQCQRSSVLTCVYN